jgi:hypothetical protein
VPPPPATDLPPLDALIAIIPCPKCGERQAQHVKVVAETSLRVVKSERPVAEMVAVCPRCNTLAVVSFHPAPLASAAAS